MCLETEYWAPVPGSGAIVQLSESGGLVLRGSCLLEDGSLGHLSWCGGAVGRLR